MGIEGSTMNMEKLEHIIVNGNSNVGELEETKEAYIIKNAAKMGSFDAKDYLIRETMGQLETLTVSKSTPIVRSALLPDEVLNAETQIGKFKLAEKLYLKQALVDFFRKY
jgi:hypothetical protein